MDRHRVAEWVAGYERAWRTPGTELLADLFIENATYRQAPFMEPVNGLPAIERMWEQEREGPDETFEMTSELVALDGLTCVVHVEVHYGQPVLRHYRDLWIIHFSPDGRCRSFEEWPFWPGQSYSAES